jgi:hypothetical protein
MRHLSKNVMTISVLNVAKIKSRSVSCKLIGTKPAKSSSVDITPGNDLCVQDCKPGAKAQSAVSFLHGLHWLKFKLLVHV